MFRRIDMWVRKKFLGIEMALRGVDPHLAYCTECGEYYDASSLWENTLHTH